MSTPHRFSALHVAVYTEHGIRYIAMADDPQDPVRYLTLQQDVSPTEQDIKFKFDRPYLELDDQRYGGYGVVQRCRLRANGVLFDLHAAAAPTFDDRPTVLVLFSIPPAELAHLAAQLRTIFNGYATVDEELSERF